jgi:hypothetical protein
MINFTVSNPLKNIKKNNDIAIDTISKKISYSDLHINFEHISKFLTENGITDQHRVLIVQSDYVLESAYIAILSVAWHGASPAYARSKKGLSDILLQAKIKAFDPTAIYFLEENSISILKPVNEISKKYKTEALCNFTHGSSSEEPFKCNAIHWNTFHGNQYGHNIESIVAVAYDLVEEPINQITNMDPIIPYSTDVLFRSICTGGKLTLISDFSLISKEDFINSNINFVCGFKKTFIDMLYLAPAGTSIKGCEFGGGPLDEETYTNIFKRLNPSKLNYHFSSYVFGYIFIKTLSRNEDKNSLNTWNENTDLYYKDKEIKFDQYGNLSIRIKSSQNFNFEDTGDRFNISNSSIVYKGRTSDDFIPWVETGGKIYIHEMENIIRSFRGVEDVKIFFSKDSTYLQKGFGDYGMVYYGEVSASDLKLNIRKTIKTKKIPKSFFKIEKSDFDKIKDRNEIVKLIIEKY